MYTYPVTSYSDKFHEQLGESDISVNLDISNTKILSRE